MNTIKILQSVGLTENEAKVYLALLELGEASVLPISKKSGIYRTYCYDILDSLIERGLVSIFERKTGRKFIANDPSNIKSQIRESEKRFDAVLPDLVSMYLQPGKRPQMRFFEGHKGIESIYNEVVKDGDEIWFVGSVQEMAAEFPDYIDIIKDQINKAKKIRDLVRKEDVIENYKHLYHYPTQQIRYLPEDMEFSTDNIIWGDKVAMISYGANLHGVIIESTEIVKTMKTFFETLWAMSGSAK